MVCLCAGGDSALHVSGGSGRSSKPQRLRVGAEAGGHLRSGSAVLGELQEVLRPVPRYAARSPAHRLLTHSKVAPPQLTACLCSLLAQGKRCQSTSWRSRPSSGIIRASRTCRAWWSERNTDPGSPRPGRRTAWSVFQFDVVRLLHSLNL